MKRGTTEHPKLLELCTNMRIRRWEAVGILESLWGFAARYTPAGDIGKYTNASIAKAIDWNRDPNRLVDALIQCRWLDSSDECRLLVHDWPDHAEDSVHMKLARAREWFANGAKPSTRRLPKTEREQAEAHYERNPCARQAHAVRTACAPPMPLPKPKPKPVEEPPLPPSGEFQLEPAANETPPSGRSLVRPAVPAKKRKASEAVEMSACQAEAFAEYLRIHPKNTIQTVKAKKLWAEKVKTDDCAAFLIATLEREATGDCTYMKGPWRWLEDHLELWANRVVPHEKPEPIDAVEAKMRQNMREFGRPFA